jgi:hypothetical protein
MGEFATPEHDRHDHLILVLQEAFCLIDLEIDVVFARLRTESNLFDFRLMDVRAVEFLLLLVLELAEVHDPADRRLFVWSHLDEIKPTLPGDR